MCVLMCVDIYVYMSVCICAYIRMYIHMHMCTGGGETMHQLPIDVDVHSGLRTTTLDPCFHSKDKRNEASIESTLFSQSKTEHQTYLIKE